MKNRFAYRLVTSILLAGLLASPFSSVKADEGDDDYKLALGLYKDESWTLAETAFQNFLTKHKEHPRSPLARLYLGQAQVQLKKYGSARSTLQDFVKKHPTSRDVPHAEYRIAECSYFLGKLEDAAKRFEAFTNDPNHDVVRNEVTGIHDRLDLTSEGCASLNSRAQHIPR